MGNIATATIQFDSERPFARVRWLWYIMRWEVYRVWIEEYSPSRSGPCSCVVDWWYVVICPAYFAPQDRPGKRCTEIGKMRPASLKTVLVGDLRSLIRHAHDATFSALTAPSLFIYFLILTTYTIAVPWALLKQDTANISRSLMETRWRLRISYSTEGWVWETESRREELGGTTGVDPEIQVSLNPRFLVSPINR